MIKWQILTPRIRDSCYCFSSETEKRANTLSNDRNIACVTWPESPKGAKDEVKHRGERIIFELLRPNSDICICLLYTSDAADE